MTALARTFAFEQVDLQTGRPELSRQAYAVSDRTLAVVSVTAAGVCTSDVLEASGHSRGRSDFGHEVVGRVVYLRQLGRLAIGDAVVLNPNVALAARSSGFAGILWLEADAEPIEPPLIAYPAGAISDELATLLEPLACTHRAAAGVLARLGRGTAASPPRVAIIGCGLMGTLIGYWLNLAGCHLDLFIRRKAQRDRLVELVLMDRGTFAVRDFAPHEATGHAAVVLSPAAISVQLVEQGSAMLDPAGLLFLFGNTRALQEAGAPYSDLDTVRRMERLQPWRHGQVGGSYGASASDFAAAIAMLGEPHHQVRLQRLLLPSIALEELPSRLAHLTAEPRQLSRSVVVFKK